MKTLFFTALFLAFFSGCGQPQEAGKKIEGETQIQLFQNEDGTWGYDISYKGKPYVHQPNRPALGGLAGFSTEGQARIVAELVAYKIRAGILPPSLSKAEVDSLTQNTE